MSIAGWRSGKTGHRHSDCHGHRPFPSGDATTRSPPPLQTYISNLIILRTSCQSGAPGVSGPWRTSARVEVETAPQDHVQSYINSYIYRILPIQTYFCNPDRHTAMGTGVTTARRGSRPTVDERRRAIDPIVRWEPTRVRRSLPGTVECPAFVHGRIGGDGWRRLRPRGVTVPSGAAWSPGVVSTVDRSPVANGE